MHKFLFLVSLLICSVYANASDPVKKPTVVNLTWHHLLLDTIVPPQQALKVMVVSTRQFSSTDTINGFLRNDLSDKGELSFLVASNCQDTCWSVTPFKSFNKGMDLMPKDRDFVFFIHGHGKGFPQVLKRSAEISQRYGVNVVVFDWPSQNGNFNRSLTMVRHGTYNLEEALDLYATYKTKFLPDSIHHTMFMHSLGNYQLIRLILDNKADIVANGTLFNNIIFNAPAIKHKKHNRLLNQISQGNHLYVMYNKNDWVLNGATLLMWSRQLGTRAMPPLADEVVYLDFTKVAQKEHTYFVGAHQFEDTIPHIQEIYYQLLHGHPFNPENKDYLAEKKCDGNYFVEP